MAVWNFEETRLKNATHASMMALFKEKIENIYSGVVIEKIAKAPKNNTNYVVLFARVGNLSNSQLTKGICCFIYPSELEKTSALYRIKFFGAFDLNHSFHDVFNNVPHSILEGISFPEHVDKEFKQFKEWYCNACVFSQYLSPFSEGSALLGVAKTGCYLVSRQMINFSDGESQMVFYVQDAKKQDYRDRPNGNKKFVMSRSFIRDNLIAVSSKDVQKLLKEASTSLHEKEKARGKLRITDDIWGRMVYAT